MTTTGNIVIFFSTSYFHLQHRPSQGKSLCRKSRRCLKPWDTWLMLYCPVGIHNQDRPRSPQFRDGSGGMRHSVAGPRALNTVCSYSCFVFFHCFAAQLREIIHPSRTPSFHWDNFSMKKCFLMNHVLMLMGNHITRSALTSRRISFKCIFEYLQWYPRP